MAIFQGENLAFKIVLKDENGDSISTDDINSIEATLYNETSKKVAVEYDETGTDPIRLIDPASDKSGFEFELSAVDTVGMAPGRYIIQIDYTVTNGVFDLDGSLKKTTQKGALVSIMKSIKNE